MEELIPLLIAAIVFGFQAFANFQKEQKKARERRFSKPVENYDQDYQEVYIPAEAAEYVPYEIPDSPYGQYQGVLETTNRGYEQGMKSHDRIRRNKNNNSQNSPLSNLKITDLDEEEENKNNPAKIDLRQAVIHAIILERPYQ